MNQLLSLQSPRSNNKLSLHLFLTSQTIDETAILQRIQSSEVDKAESLRQLFFKLPKQEGGQGGQGAEALDKKDCLDLLHKIHLIMKLPDDTRQEYINGKSQPSNRFLILLSEWWEYLDDNSDGRLSWAEFKQILRIVEVPPLDPLFHYYSPLSGRSHSRDGPCCP